MGDVPLAVCERMWIQHDVSVDVHNHLNAVFSGCWIGKGGPVPWPVRSPDLNPFAYFLCRYLKALVFETPVETDMKLVARIVAACTLLKTHQGYLSGCSRILYADVILALRLVAVNLSNCCKMQYGTLIVSTYCICR